MASGVEVRQVAAPPERTRFVRLPWALYQGDPHWVPPLRSAVDSLLDVSRNPFFEHGECTLFLACRGGQPVGRVAAIIDHAHNQRFAESTGFWGFFETVNDFEVAAALLDAAGDHLRGRGMTVMRGPFNPNINGECGLLVDGFDSMPFVLMPYNPPYYPRLVARAGFIRHMDLYAYYVRSDQVAPHLPTMKRFERLAAAIRTRHPGLSVRHIDMTRYDDEVLTFGRLFNAARSENWGFVPMTDDEIRAMARAMKPIVDPGLVIACDLDGEPVGCIMGIPDVSPALKKMNGRLFPFGWLHFLLGKRRAHTCRIFGAGTLPEYRHAGVTILLILEYIRRSLYAGYDAGEVSWVAASNVRSLGVIEKALQLARYKTYRIYEREL